MTTSPTVVGRSTHSSLLPPTNFVPSIPVRSPLTVFGFMLCLLILSSGLQPLTAQSSVRDADAHAGKFNVDLNAVLLALPDVSETVTGFSVRLASQLDCSNRRRWNRPAWCVLLEVEFMRIPGPFPDPWQNMPPIIVIPPIGPDPDPTLFNGLPLNELQIGDTWMFSPTVGIDFPLADRLSLAASAGGGFSFSSGASTQIGQRGTFTTNPATSPLISYNLALKYMLGNRLNLRAEAQGIHLFHENLEVTGPDGSLGIFAGMNMFTPAFKIGIGINLGDPTPQPN